METGLVIGKYLGLGLATMLSFGLTGVVLYHGLSGVCTYIIRKFDMRCIGDIRYSDLDESDLKWRFDPVSIVLDMVVGWSIGILVVTVVLGATGLMMSDLLNL